MQRSRRNQRISTLVSCRPGDQPHHFQQQQQQQGGKQQQQQQSSIRNDRQLRAIVRIGQSVNFAVERFAAVGEAIADDNPEIRAEMYDACKDGRAAGSLIEQLCSLTAPSLQRSSSAVGVGGTSSGGDGNLTNHLGSASPGGGGGGGGGQSSAGYDSGGSGGREATGGGGGSDPNGSTSASSIRSYADRTAMSRAARALLSSVTRVLLVADTVVVKQIVTSKDRVSMSLNRLENVANFTEFVKAFSHFGMEMVELAHLTNDRQNDLKNEKRRAQMSAARRTLERSTMLLLTTSKACLRHPDCQSARDNRDTVFAQMRRAMDLIHFVIKEGVLSSGGNAGRGGGGGMDGMSSPLHHHHHHPHHPHSHHFRPNSSNSSSSSSLHAAAAAAANLENSHFGSLFYGELGSPRGGEGVVAGTPTGTTSGRHSRSELYGKYQIPKYQRRGQLHRAQATSGGSFVLAVESTLRWLHEQLDTCPTIVNFLRRVGELLELARMGPLTGPVREQIAFSLEAALERTQDFTDSAYTSHERREKILLLADTMKAELVALFQAASTAALMNESRVAAAAASSSSATSPPPLDMVEDIEASLMRMARLTTELRYELQEAALEQAEELFRQHASLDLPALLKHSALDCDHEQVDELIEQYREQADHVQEVARLLFHIAPTAAMQVTAGHTETSIEIHAEQMLTALNSVLMFPQSKIVKENYEVFADVWATLLADIGGIMREVAEYLRSVMPPPPPPMPLPLSQQLPTPLRDCSPGGGGVSGMAPPLPPLAPLPGHTAGGQLPHHLHHPSMQRPPPQPPRPPNLGGGGGGGGAVGGSPHHPMMMMGSAGPLHGAMAPPMGPPPHYPPHMMGPHPHPHHPHHFPPHHPHHPHHAHPGAYGPMHGDTAGDQYGPGAPMLPPDHPANYPPHHPHYPYHPGQGYPPGGPLPPPLMKNGRPQQNVQINPEVDVVEIPSNVSQGGGNGEGAGGGGDGGDGNGEGEGGGGAGEGAGNSMADQQAQEENDIVRKAKSMSAMAMAMFQFTRGEGELKTTQDLFTQAEFFSDEANKMYKIVRHFTYQIPAGLAKKELLDCIDQVPTYVQQLQFAVKNVTVGKTATFTKVDNVIQETKNLMSVITRVVAACMNCANKYNLDMQGALRTRSRTLSPSYRADTEMFFEGGAMSKGVGASSDSDL